MGGGHWGVKTEARQLLEARRVGVVHETVLMNKGTRDQEPTVTNKGTRDQEPTVTNKGTNTKGNKGTTIC